jgi:gliding motility-associated-like protein
LVFEVPSWTAVIEHESCVGANDGSISLVATNGNPPYTYMWSNSSTEPSLNDLNPDTFTFTITDNNGCSVGGEETVLSSDIDCNTPHVFIPTIFSPNGDGINDILYVRGEGIEFMQFVIFSRWGQKLFESSNQTLGWDGTFKGKHLDPGVYVYYLEVTFTNGEKHNTHGDITLIR